MLDGSGFRDWVNEVADATTIDQYLQSQVLMRFATSAARDAAITAPKEGAHCYLDDANVICVYNGTAWVNAVAGRTFFNGLTSSSYMEWDADGATGIDANGIRVVVLGTEVAKFGLDGDYSVLMFGEPNDGFRYNRNTEVLEFHRNTVQILRLDADSLDLAAGKLRFNSDFSTDVDYIDHTGTGYEFFSNGVKVAELTESGGLTVYSGPIRVDENADELVRLTRRGSNERAGYISYRDDADTEIGVVGCDSSDDMVVAAKRPDGNVFLEARNARRLKLDNIALAPHTTAVLDLGTSTKEFKDCYLVNAVTVSSDERFKTRTGPVLGRDFLELLEPFAGTYDDLDDSDEYQFLSAQNVVAALDAVGADHTTANMWLVDDNGRMRLRYEQLIPVLVDDNNRLAARLAETEAANAALAARLDALEARAGLTDPDKEPDNA